MGRIAIDLKGKQFGRLKVKERAGVDKGGNALWLCECICGKFTIVRSQHLRNNETQSCGCLSKQNALKYGESKTRIGMIWRAMINRCCSERNPNYKHYGGRGISVCDEWLNYYNFRDWSTSNGYEDNLTLERKNVNGNYEPNNCKWATMKEQENNRTNNHLITFNGETKTLQQWSEVTGISRETLRSRILRGWPSSKALAS
jgi:hypothetical protein